jgi:hypothetical protein
MLRRFPENCRSCVACSSTVQAAIRLAIPRQPVHPFPDKPVEGVPSIIAGIVFVVVSYAADIRACRYFDAQAHGKPATQFSPGRARAAKWLGHCLRVG